MNKPENSVKYENTFVDHTINVLFLSDNVANSFPSREK